MPATSRGAQPRGGEPLSANSRGGDAPLNLPQASNLFVTRTHLSGAVYSVIDWGGAWRVALLMTPSGKGTLAAQLCELLAAMDDILAGQPYPMTVTSQTVFLRNEGDWGECRRLLARHFHMQMPATNFAVQPPSSGAALAMEVWAVGGPDVRIERVDPFALAVTCNDVRWVHCGGIQPPRNSGGVYAQTLAGLDLMRRTLEQAGSGFEQCVRTWFYLEQITGEENGVQRYMELNRARTDFYRGIPFCGELVEPGLPQRVYPASTGIGASGLGLAMGCLALQTDRNDASLLALENPAQVPAYVYHPRYSPESPKFARAIALVLGNEITTWISGTASIVDSESCHPGDIVKQTLQTLDNIEQLIAPANFQSHGVKDGGAQLSDIAKIRVYLKRQEDFARCREVCESRFGSVPAIFVNADVCRPELLVEIEGVAFSKLISG